MEKYDQYIRPILKIDRSTTLDFKTEILKQDQILPYLKSGATVNPIAPLF